MLSKEELAEAGVKACTPLRRAYRSIVLSNVGAVCRSKGVEDDKIIAEVYAAVVEQLEQK